MKLKSILLTLILLQFITLGASAANIASDKFMQPDGTGESATNLNMCIAKYNRTMNITPTSFVIPKWGVLISNVTNASSSARSAQLNLIYSTHIIANVSLSFSLDSKSSWGTYSYYGMLIGTLSNWDTGYLSSLPNGTYGMTATILSHNFGMSIDGYEPTGVGVDATPAEADYGNETRVTNETGFVFNCHTAVNQVSGWTDDGVFILYYEGADFGGGETAGNSTLSGYTLNAYTNQTLSNVLVRSDQGTFIQTNYSLSNGAYEIFDLLNDVEATISASKASYFAESFTFTPSGSTDYIANISLIPDYITNKTAIVGIVYANWDHDPIKNAIVTLENDTWSDTYTTSVSGFFMFDHLAGGEIYDLSATATSYDNSDVYEVTTVAGYTVQQDIPLDANFDVTVTAKDGSTGAIIQGIPVYFEASDGQTANSTLGYVVFTMDGGYWTFTATAEGYSVGQQTAGVSADTSVTLLLYNNSYIPPDVVTYPAHQVKFVIKNEWGTPLENIHVTAQGMSTTAGDWAWLYSLLGINFDSTPIHNASMAGYTGEDGSIVFMMVESVRYDMTITNATQGVSETYSLFPKDDYYEIWVAGTGFYTSGYNALEEINITVSSIRKNTTHGFINVTYKDALVGTTGGTIYVNQTNKTGVDLPETTVKSYSIPSSDFNTSFTVPADGDSYFVTFGIQHSTFGTVVRTFAVIFEKVQVGIGLPNSWLIYIAVFFILFTGMFFGAVTSPTVGAIITSFVGWIFWGLGWLEDMGIAAPTALVFATFISVLSIIMARSRKERYL